MEIIEEKFYKNVRKNENGCWDWIGNTSAYNRGRMTIGGRKMYAYHISYELHIGPIPTGMQINHTCDNPNCVNPEHLYAGTQSDNTRDAIRRGRWVNNSTGRVRSHLSPDDVRAIRQQCASVSMTEVGKRFGISYTQVRRIVTGKHWKDIS
jgi:HNH endonuclease